MLICVGIENQNLSTDMSKTRLRENTRKNGYMITRSYGPTYFRREMQRFRVSTLNRANAGNMRATWWLRGAGVLIDWESESELEPEAD